METKVDLLSSPQFNAEMAHTFQGMVQGFNIATGTELVAVTGTSAFVIENQAGVPFARIRREDVTGSEVLYQWLESAKDALLMGHVVQIVRKATPEEEARLLADRAFRLDTLAAEQTFLPEGPTP